MRRLRPSPPEAGPPVRSGPPPSGPTGAPAPWAFRSFRCGSVPAPSRVAPHSSRGTGPSPRRCHSSAIFSMSTPLPLREAPQPSRAARAERHGCRRACRRVGSLRNGAPAPVRAAHGRAPDRRGCGSPLTALCVEAPGRKPETCARYARLDEALDGTRRRLLAVEEGRYRQGPAMRLLLCPKPDIRHFVPTALPVRLAVRRRRGAGGRALGPRVRLPACRFRAS